MRSVNSILFIHFELYFQISKTKIMYNLYPSRTRQNEGDKTCTCISDIQTSINITSKTNLVDKNMCPTQCHANSTPTKNVIQFFLCFLTTWDFQNTRFLIITYGMSMCSDC
ncbi:hypothetical protein ACF0H5_000341 [Mactra antiquata]